MQQEKSRKKYENQEKNKKRIRATLLKTGALAMLLIVSTYAWFTSQKDITLSNLRGTVEVQENMEISLDAKTWHQEIDLTDAVNVFAQAQASRDIALGENTDTTTRTTAPALLPKQLLPVSGVGEIGGTVLPLYTGTTTSISLSNISATTEIDASTKTAKETGYFAFDIYIKNTSQDGADDVLQLNLNSAVQVLVDDITKQVMVNGTNMARTYKGDAASGLQNTVRVGLALYSGTASSTATQKEILEATRDFKADGSANVTVSDIAIWEPNAKNHVEYIVSNNNKLINGVGENTEIPFADGEEVETYALTEDAIGETIENVYNIRTTGLDIQNTFKTDKTSDDDYRILTSGKPLNIQNISKTDFKIKSNAVSRLRVYVWLEGQDVDCINLASQGGGIELDLGFTKDDSVGDVMDEDETVTSLASVTNSNIGEYINLGNDIVDYNGTTGVKTDDWRIFYVDEDAGKIYAILSSYLPNSTGYANAAGLLTTDDASNDLRYSVRSSSENGEDFVSKLTNNTSWNDLANSISGASATATPTGDLLLKSYNAENGTNLNFENMPNLKTNCTTGDYSLYIPHTETVNGCEGYWLATPYIDYYVWTVNYIGSLGNGGWQSESCHTTFIKGIRPVVSLPTITPATKVDGVWTVSN